MRSAPRPLADADLLARARDADPRALEAIMRQHNRAMYRTARAILRDDAEAEDAVQEAYLRAFAALGEFRGEAKLSTWLVRIAANEALMRRRSAARKAAVVPLRAEGEHDFEEQAMSQDPGPELDAQRAEMRRL
ncbi:MAG TPA: sigma-70 family RNA polymerase sigma factor, partial [Burkholderiales bacterium]|nr:sigma-70 family RNA polymerase sigma factor [Burkholderiales bacterium]